MSSLYKYVKMLIFVLLIVGFYSCKEDSFQPELFGTIKGKVIDLSTDEIIAGASVTTSPPTNAIMSNANGEFTIENVPVGNYSVSASKNGYIKGSVSISVKEDAAASAVIFLEKKIGNVVPNQPIDPVPAEGAVNVPTTVTLSWSASDPDLDSLIYDIYLYESNSSTQTKIETNYSDTAIQVEDLNFNTTYYWQVVVKDTAGGTANGEIWSFTTIGQPNNPFFFASKESGNYEIYSSDSLQSSKIKLTNNSAREWWVRVSPDNDKIAYVSDENVSPQIFTMNIDGSNKRQITSLPVTGYHNNGIGFCWSHNGDYILYSHYDKLYRINYDGTSLTQIAAAPSGRHFREVAMSSLGNKIAVITIGSLPYESEIYLMDPDGSNMTQFIADLPGSLGGPEFTIDGTKLLFTHDVSGYESAAGRQLDASIFMISIDLQDTVNLSLSKTPGTNDFNPRFSPDGSHIIFENVINNNSGTKEIWLMNITGLSRKRLFSGETPDWK